MKPEVWLLIGIIIVVSGLACSNGEYRGPGENRSSPFPTASQFDSIDYSVKENVGMWGPVPTDGEIRRACQALQNAAWDYWSMSQNWGSGTSMRSVMIAASLTMFASRSELVDYCNSK